jgi:hypothetical protein
MRNYSRSSMSQNWRKNWMQTSWIDNLKKSSKFRMRSKRLSSSYKSASSHSKHSDLSRLRRPRSLSTQSLSDWRRTSKTRKSSLRLRLRRCRWGAKISFLRWRTSMRLRRTRLNSESTKRKNGPIRGSTKYKRNLNTGTETQTGKKTRKLSCSRTS